MMMERVMAKVRLGESVPLQWVGLDWYVASVDHGRDAEARDWLEASGVPVFMVEGKRRVRSSSGRGKRSLEIVPLFRGYLFVASLERVQRTIAKWQWDRWRRSMDCPVQGLLGTSGKPTRVNGFAMQALFAAHEGGWFDEGEPLTAEQVRIGESIRVTVGPFAEVVGVVHAIVNKSEIDITTKLFGGSAHTRVRLDSVVKVHP